MKCKEHRRYSGHTQPDNDCEICYRKWIGKGATPQDISDAFDWRVIAFGIENVEPAFYEFEEIDIISWMLRGKVWDLKKRGFLK